MKQQILLSMETAKSVNKIFLTQTSVKAKFLDCSLSFNVKRSNCLNLSQAGTGQNIYFY